MNCWIILESVQKLKFEKNYEELTSLEIEKRIENIMMMIIDEKKKNSASMH